jgi:hypothetical protein
MAGFRHLRHDLDRFGATFLRGGAKAATSASHSA